MTEELKVHITDGLSGQDAQDKPTEPVKAPKKKDETKEKPV